MSRSRMPAKVLTVAVGAALLAVMGREPSLVTVPAHAQTAPPPGEFSLIFASDPQLPWWRNKKGGVCITNYVDDDDDDHDEYDQCIEREGRRSNEDLVAGMNAVTSLGNWPLTGLAKSGGAPVTTPWGVVLNGDLTEFFHRLQKEMFDEIYGRLTHRIYPGLGNHDYQNNLDLEKKRGDCAFAWRWAGDDYRCAKEAVWWMARQIGQVPSLVRHDAPGFVRVNNNSGYNIRFRVSFRVNGSADSRTSDEYEFLERRTLTIPPGATDVSATIQGLVFTDDGLAWKNIATRSLGAPAAGCFAASGTAFPGNQNVGSTDCLDEDIPGGGTAFGDGSSGSLAYSFEIGGYHFVQLQNRPGYAANLPASDSYAFSPSFDVTDSYTWLRRDLELATAAGKNIILNMHDTEWLLTSSKPEVEAVNRPQRDRFYAAIRDQNVVGVFAGHIHEKAGLRLEIANGLRDRIPVFYSGAAECRDFLYVDFHERYYNVGLVVTPGGAPAFAPATWTCDTFEPYNGGPLSVPRTVDFNIPPRIQEAFVNTSPVREGRPADFIANAFDRDGDDITFRWDFGDGQSDTSSFFPNAVHSYADDGTYTVRFTVEDSLGFRTTRAFDVVVENVSPVLTASPGIAVDENGLASISGTISDPGILDAFDLTVEWGDGRSTPVRYPPRTTEFSVSHQYLDDNPTGTPADDFRVSLTLTDGDGGSASTTTNLRVNNVAPTLSAIGSTVEENGVATVSGTIRDPGTEDTLLLAIVWGDGAFEQQALPARTSTFSKTHRYLDDNPTGTPSDTHFVVVSVVDDDQGTGAALAPVMVRNVDPVASIQAVTDELGSIVGSQAPVVLVGQAITLVAGVVDAGTLDTHTASVDCGDGRGSDLGVLTAKESASHRFKAPGGYGVVLTVRDDDTGADTDVSTVQVVDAAGGIRAAAGILSAIETNSPTSPAARREIEKAIAAAVGNDEEGASNGATDKLARGDLSGALENLRRVVEALARAKLADDNLDLTFGLRLVGLSAKSIATGAVDRATRNVRGPSDLARIAEARALVALGDRHLADGAFRNATIDYRDALQPIKGLI